MDAKERLKSYCLIQERIEDIDAEIDTLRGVSAVSYGDTRSSGGGDLSGKVIRIQRLQEERQMLVHRMTDILMWIAPLPEQCFMVVYHKYIEHGRELSLREVAEDMELSEGHVGRLHAAALRELEK